MAGTEKHHPGNIAGHRLIGRSEKAFDAGVEETLYRGVFNGQLLRVADTCRSASCSLQTASRLSYYMLLNHKITCPCGLLLKSQYPLPVKVFQPCLRPCQQKRSLEARGSTAQEVFQIASAVSDFTALASLGASVGILFAFAKSAAPVVTEQSKNSQRSPADQDEAEGIKWGLMSVISCLPVFNWLAWIFAAFEDESRASFYYTLAALYAVPQLSAGFQPNLLSVGTLLLGLAHVQAERVADERGIIRDNSFEVGDLVASAGQILSGTTAELSEATLTEGAPQQQRKIADEEESGENEQAAGEELKKWDELFESRRTEKDASSDR